MKNYLSYQLAMTLDNRNPAIDFDISPLNIGDKAKKIIDVTIQAYRLSTTDFDSTMGGVIKMSCEDFPRLNYPATSAISSGVGGVISHTPEDFILIPQILNTGATVNHLWQLKDIDVRWLSGSLKFDITWNSGSLSGAENLYMGVNIAYELL